MIQILKIMMIIINKIVKKAEKNLDLVGENKGVEEINININNNSGIKKTEVKN